MGPLGLVSGRVTDPDGGPVAGVTVTARSTTYVSPAPAAQAVTGADGRYTLRLDTQAEPRLFAPDAPDDRTFTVTVAPGGPLYVVPSDRIVTLTGTSSPAARGADFVVTVGPQITVHVRDALTGAPVPGVPVEYPSISGGDTPGELAGVTDARGEARFRTHDLHVNLQIRPGADLQAVPGENPYKYYLLSPLQSAVWDVTLSNPAAAAHFAWRGVALGPDGRPAPGALVRLLRAPSSPLSAEAVTDDAGGFTFAASAAAPYDLSPQSPVLLAERGDLSAVASAPFDVRGGKITLRLQKTVRASVAGRVTDPDGVPLAGVPVYGSGYVPPAPDYGSRPLDVSAVTDAAGRFLVSGLLPGAAWRFFVGGQPGAAGGLWAYSRTEYPPYKAGDVMLPPVVLAAGERRDIGRVVVLRADAAVAGRVVGPDGKPAAAPLAVEVDGAHADATVFLGADGLFRAERLVHEPLTLNVYRSHSGYSGGPKSPDFVLQMPVTAGDQNVRVSVPAQPAAPFPATFIPPPPPALRPAFRRDYARLPGAVFVGPAGASHPAPDEAAAVQVARAFLRRIGEAGAVAVRPGAPANSGFFRRTWDVLTSYSPSLRLTLAADTGAVVDVEDTSPAAPDDALTAPLTKAQAIGRGAAILRAAGCPRGYACLYVRLFPPNSFLQGWNLSWMEQYHGIPFPAGGGLTERLDERTGRLLELRLWSLPPDPATDREKINAAGAVALADAVLDRAGVPPGAASRPFKQVVVPNGAWGGPAPSGPSAGRALPARVAWIVQRPLPAAPPGAEVWVDAQTGAALGGLRPSSAEAPRATPSP